MLHKRIDSNKPNLKSRHLKGFLIRNILQSLIIYSLVGGVILWIEYYIPGKASFEQNAKLLLGIATCFFLFNLIGNKLYTSVIYKHLQNHIISYYIALKIFRMFLAILLFLVCAMLGFGDLLTLSLNIMAFYVVAMTCSIYYIVKMEQKLK